MPLMSCFYFCFCFRSPIHDHLLLAAVSSTFPLLLFLFSNIISNLYFILLLVPSILMIDRMMISFLRKPYSPIFLQSLDEIGLDYNFSTNLIWFRWLIGLGLEFGLTFFWLDCSVLYLWYEKFISAPNFRYFWNYFFSIMIWFPQWAFLKFFYWKPKNG